MNPALLSPPVAYTADTKIFRAQRGPQELFLSTPADIAIYGGSAGGGKTWALLYEGLRHAIKKTLNGFGGVIFRRTYPQITNKGGMWEKSLELYPHFGAKGREGNLDWKFPTGARIQFAHMQYEQDRIDWDGSEIPYLAFDQLEHFTRRQFIYMLTRNRTTCGIKPYVRATCNPVPAEDVTGGWLNKFVGWWVDQETGYAIPERSGVIRYFVAIDDEFYWGDTADELVEKYGAGVSPKSCTFIRSSVFDNKILLAKDPGYLSNLKAQCLVDRLRLLFGNWNARESAGMFFKKHYFEIIEPEALPPLKRRARYWDQAATKQDKSKLDSIKGPSATAGVKGGFSENGILYLEDIIHLQEGPLAVETATDNAASQDGKACEIIIEEDPGQAGKQTAQAYVRRLQSKGFIAKSNRVHESKGTRAKPVSAAAEAGNVKLVRGNWNGGFLSEAENYDGGIKTKADRIDALSGLYNELTNARSGGVWGRK